MWRSSSSKASPSDAQRIVDGTWSLAMVVGAAAVADDQPRRQDDPFGASLWRLDAMEQQGGRRFADLARPGGQRGERRAAIGRLDDVVEADHGAVPARRDSLVGEPEHDAEGTDV